MDEEWVPDKQTALQQCRRGAKGEREESAGVAAGHCSGEGKAGQFGGCHFTVEDGRLTSK